MKHGQDNLLKFKLCIRIGGKKGDLSDFERRH